MVASIMPRQSANIVIRIKDSEWEDMAGRFGVELHDDIKRLINKAVNEYIGFIYAHAYSATKDEVQSLLEPLQQCCLGLQEALGDVLGLELSEEGYAELDAALAGKDREDSQLTYKMFRELVPKYGRNIERKIPNEYKNNMRVGVRRISICAQELLFGNIVDYDEGRAGLLDLYWLVDDLRKRSSVVIATLPCELGADGDPYLSEFVYKLMVQFERATNGKGDGKVRDEFIASILRIVKAHHQEFWKDPVDENFEEPDGRVEFSHHFEECLSSQGVRKRVNYVHKLRRERPEGPISSHGWTTDDDYDPLGVEF